MRRHICHIYITWSAGCFGEAAAFGCKCLHELGCQTVSDCGACGVIALSVREVFVSASGENRVENVKSRSHMNDGELVRFSMSVLLSCWHDPQFVLFSFQVLEELRWSSRLWMKCPLARQKLECSSSKPSGSHTRSFVEYSLSGLGVQSSRADWI